MCKQRRQHHLPSNTLKFDASEKHETNSKRRIKKSVTFSQNETYEIDYIPKKLSHKIWYSDAELESISAKNLRHASRINQGKVICESQRFTSRGLEFSGTPKSLEKRMYRMAKAVAAVLREQKRQKQMGINDPHLIAAWYESNGAKKCLVEAYEIGLKDKEAAIDIRKEDISSLRTKRKLLLNATNMRLKRIAHKFSGQ